MEALNFFTLCSFMCFLSCSCPLLIVFECECCTYSSQKCFILIGVWTHVSDVQSLVWYHPAIQASLSNIIVLLKYIIRYWFGSRSQWIGNNFNLTQMSLVLHYIFVSKVGINGITAYKFIYFLKKINCLCYVYTLNLILSKE